MESPFRRRPRPRAAGAARLLGSMDVDGHEVRVEVRPSTRARRGRLVLRAPDLVELVVPAGTTDAIARRLVRGREAWIRRRAGALREEQARDGLGLQREDVVWLAGAAVPVRRVPGPRATADLVDGVLVVAGSPEEAGDAVARWYRREARRRILAAVHREAARLGLDHAGVAIRDTRSRWGSCSARGGLSFSWRLVVAPEPVLDYVVVHELCHRRELNHSRRFWRLVDAACPDWRASAAWLRRHGGELHAYRPVAVAPAGDAPAGR